MGDEFIALIDVIPEDTDVDFVKFIEKIKGVLSEECTLEAHDIMPVAFGLKKARIRVRYPADWGGTDNVEEMLKQLDGVQGIEAIAFSKA
ncbi:MAG: elongation factor 1-beta [Promethearchaeota archaeon]